MHVLFSRKLSYQFFRSCSNLGSFNILKITDLSSKVITVFAFNTPDVLKWSNTNACQAVSNRSTGQCFSFRFYRLWWRFPPRTILNNHSISERSESLWNFLPEAGKTKPTFETEMTPGFNLSQTFILFWNRNHWWPWLATGTRLHIFRLSKKWKFFI